jgi:hypothetical protein
MLASDSEKAKQILDKLHHECGGDRKKCVGLILLVLSIILFSLLFYFFTGPGSRFGDRHFKVPKTAKTHFRGTLPGSGSN